MNTRRQFYEELIRLGVTTPTELLTHYPLGCGIAKDQMETWVERLCRPQAAPALGKQPRLINRFKLGADPEFIFEDAVRMRLVGAGLLKMKTGLAFGTDQNGRLCELRPKPYRSALKVVASILQELRWLSRLHPETVGYNWISGAFQHDDGLGGHVHFGRKRNTRNAEIQALAGIMTALAKLRVYPGREVARRMQGDARGQIYGQLNDYRLQEHGYEYRAFPSWLDSPWAAFLTIVLAKLAVVNPPMFSRWASPMEMNPRLIEYVLAFYAPRDDDAALALYVLRSRGLPTHIGGDFKARWGIAPTNEGPLKITVIPTSIAPTTQCMSDLYEHFVRYRPLRTLCEPPNWSPLELPDGYTLVTDRNDLNKYKGFGELVWDMCAWNAKLVMFSASQNGECDFAVSSALARLMPSDWKRRVQTLIPTARLRVYTDGNFSISIGNDLRCARTSVQTRKALLSGLFPLWSARTVTLDCWTQWQEGIKPQVPRRRLGAVLYQS